MIKRVDVIIIGTGTAALSAAKEVKRVTDNFIIISNGTYGTTCVRAGCMPSKVFIRASQLFDSKQEQERFGIDGSNALRMDTGRMLTHVRTMRDHFMESALAETEKFRPYIIEGKAIFKEDDHVEVNGILYQASAIILATGSKPIIPPEWQEFSDLLITSDTLFEQKELPPTMGVIGLSVLGAEMAQALARLGVEVTASHSHTLIAGLTDPAVSNNVAEYMAESMTLWLGESSTLTRQGNKLLMKTAGHEALVDKVLIAVGRSANLETFGLDKLGICEKGAPFCEYDCETMQLDGHAIYIAGDVKLGRAMLHHAADEGKIAGFNAVRKENTRFKRRVPIQICYTAPEACIAGASYESLKDKEIIIGESSYEDQGRAKILGANHGLMHVYADANNGIILGAEMAAPGAEHMTHLIACIIENKMTLTEALRLPFYHPTLEEGLRTALRHAAKQLPESEKAGLELERLN